MIFEKDKSYRLEILIVYAQNKFVYAHGFNFFINLRVPNFTWNFSFRERDKKNETSDMHENLIDYTQDILIHIYDIKFVSNCLIF